MLGMRLKQIKESIEHKTILNVFQDASLYCDLLLFLYNRTYIYIIDLLAIDNT